MNLYYLKTELTYNASYEGSIETGANALVWAMSEDDAIDFFNKNSNSETSIWERKAISAKMVTQVRSKMKNKRFY